PYTTLFRSEARQVAVEIYRRCQPCCVALLQAQTVEVVADDVPECRPGSQAELLMPMKVERVVVVLALVVLVVVVVVLFVILIVVSVDFAAHVIGAGDQKFAHGSIIVEAVVVFTLVVLAVVFLIVVL